MNEHEIKSPEVQSTSQVNNLSMAQTKNLTIPVAIIVAGMLIAGAVYFSASKNTTIAGVNNQPQQGAEQLTESLDQMKAVSKDDHIRGNLDAPVKIVEYSDTECPFCKHFHKTMNQIMDEYGKDGKVAWVYRHFPIDQLHPIKARSEATAFECANELGGNDKFWAYADRLYEITPSNNGLDQAELPKIAAYVGLDTAKFNTCLTSGKFDKHIEDEVQNAIATGANGTPWSIIVAKKGKKYPISGALPYASIKQLIDLALKEK